MLPAVIGDTPTGPDPTPPDPLAEFKGKVTALADTLNGKTWRDVKAELLAIVS